MIDPATSWFEMKEITNKEANTVANIVEKTWLTQYPWPKKVTYDQGSEFLAEFGTMIQKDYGIDKHPASTRNPQANAIIERVHQTMGNIVRTFNVEQLDLPKEDPWGGILAAAMFAIRATYHTTLQATPSQLVFGRDAILNTKFEANWLVIKQHKQEIINKNNIAENAKRIEHIYKIGDYILYKNAQPCKYRIPPYA